MAEDGSGTPSSRAGGGGEPSASDRSGSIDLWRRWSGDSDVPFHRFCDFFPRRDGPRRATDAADTRDDDTFEPKIRFLSGAPRAVLRYTPLFILLSWLALVVSAEYSPNRTGLGAFFDLAGTSILTAFLLLVWLLVLLWLLSRADILLNREFIEGLLVSLIGAGLFAGTIFSIVYVSIAIRTGIPAEEVTGEIGAVVLSSNLLLMMFIGGHLVYDGMLRTENMFSKLHEKNRSIIASADDTSTGGDGSQGDEDAGDYEDFLDAFDTSLRCGIEIPPGSFPGGGLVRVPVVYAFAILFVTPFLLSGLVLAHGSLAAAARSIFVDPFWSVPLLVSTFLVVLNVMVFFQFMVLISYFYELLTNHRPSNDDVGFVLRYQPRHPDGYAGFRDMGRFATRVNTLLIFGGLYVVSRVYLGGLPLLQTIDVWAMNAASLNWIFTFLGPVAAYVLTVIVWVYFSFWQIHKTMREGRDRTIDRAASEHDGELPEEKLDYKQAPVWPINYRVFASLILGDLLPLITLFPVIR